jgi:hypothetical protein
MDFGEDLCQGDSGGLLVLKSSQGADVQVGVVLWRFGCAQKDFPGLYSRVSSAYDWIRETTCRRSVSPPADFNCDDMKLSLLTEVAQSILKDLAEWSLPNGSTIGGEEGILIDDVQSLSKISLNEFSPMTKCLLPYPRREHPKIVRIEVAREVGPNRPV